MKFRVPVEGPWVPAGAMGRAMGPAKTGDWRTTRPEIKVAKCCHCGVCYLFCTAGCIRDRGTYFSADLDYCKGCGICASVCPVNAIRIVREIR